MSDININPKSKFIFITGGVVSSLGKGLASASLAAILQARGYKVRMRKLDPYLNVDPGTMNPCQHGEVFVTDDGTEADLDLGHYERFSGVPAKRSDSITTGKIYQRVIDKERRGFYLGSTIQVIPHVTNEIKEFILSDITDEDFVLCEIGGTVGDIEGQPYLETIRQVAYELGRDRTMFIHVTLLPFIPGTWLALMVTVNSYPSIQKYIINPYYEKRGEVNPEIELTRPASADEAVFSDMGGMEKPVDLKVQPVKTSKNPAKEHKGKIIS